MNDKRTTDEIDALAQEIRRVDGENNLGAGALAEALMPFLTELQHRREAEEAGRDAVIEEMAKIFDQFPDDKMYSKQAASRIRARKSLAASPSSPASGVRVKAITWQENGATSIWSGELVFGVYYTIYDEGTGWRVFWRQFLSGAEDTEIAYAAKLDDAKEAAQAHFDAAIRSALGEHP
jgi:DNA-binding protein H-NS